MSTDNDTGRGVFTDLPFIQVPPVPLPEGHPDLDTFDADMAAIAKSARWLWIYALHGNPKPEMPSDALIFDTMRADCEPDHAVNRLAIERGWAA
jgi:hypothetical protein